MPKRKAGWTGWKSGRGCSGTTINAAAKANGGRAPLTPRQEQVLVALKSYIARHGWPPSTRELADRFGWSGPAAAHYSLKAIERKGWIVIGHGKARAIRIVRE